MTTAAVKYEAMVHLHRSPGQDHVVPILARLRHAGLHARSSYKSTRNLGKLLKEASQHRSRTVVILGGELKDGVVAVKDLDTGTQQDVPLEDLESTLSGLVTTT